VAASLDGDAAAFLARRLRVVDCAAAFHLPRLRALSRRSLEPACRVLQL